MKNYWELLTFLSFLYMWFYRLKFILSHEFSKYRHLFTWFPNPKKTLKKVTTPPSKSVMMMIGPSKELWTSRASAKWKIFISYKWTTLKLLFWLLCLRYPLSAFLSWNTAWKPGLKSFTVAVRSLKQLTFILKVHKRMYRLWNSRRIGFSTKSWSTFSMGTCQLLSAIVCKENIFNSEDRNIWTKD